ncbi:ycf60 protein [Perilla frutescens var. frutescens]|nr:ycf60 protein [Perilla frutescens var. frutescens]
MGEEELILEVRSLWLSLKLLMMQCRAIFHYIERCSSSMAQDKLVKRGFSCEVVENRRFRLPFFLCRYSSKDVLRESSGGERAVNFRRLLPPPDDGQPPVGEIPVRLEGGGAYDPAEHPLPGVLPATAGAPAHGGGDGRYYSAAVGVFRRLPVCGGVLYLRRPAAAARFGNPNKTLKTLLLSLSTIIIMASSIPLLRLSLPPTHRLHHPLKSTLPPPPQLLLRLRSTTPTKCSYTPTPATDRLISAASYFIPFFNGLQYGRFLFAKYPILAAPLEPLIPLVSLYHSVPYASFVTFFGIYLGVVRNPNFSRYARFNALQALVLDVLLVLPVLLQRIISPGRTGIALKVTAWAYSGLFLFVLACFVYGLVSSVLGKTPYLPIVAQAARRQLE